jgi:hypothetical protein
VAKGLEGLATALVKRPSVSVRELSGRAFAFVAAAFAVNWESLDWVTAELLFFG